MMSWVGTLMKPVVFTRKPVVFTRRPVVFTRKQWHHSNMTENC